MKARKFLVIYAKQHITHTQPFLLGAMGDQMAAERLTVRNETVFLCIWYFNLIIYGL